MIQFTDWSGCEKVWEECAKTNTACGCIATPTIWGVLLVAVIVAVSYFLLKYFWIIKENLQIINNND